MNSEFEIINNKTPASAGVWYVYIMTNKPSGVLYICVTDDIEARVQEHKNKLYKKSFTAKFNCDKLVYFEEIFNASESTVREKQLKKWNRQWKIRLIEELNPSWMDISMNWNNEDLIYKTKYSRIGGNLGI
ncbi:MAG: GIY-YIG nuclease family protein [Flavobacteriaceae bacterium]|nr:GIY-YIG nuclease family protein [Flavobacteriaceae bacterium]